MHYLKEKKKELGVCLGWVKLRGFFDLTHHNGLKKSNPIQPVTGVQPNPHGSGCVGLNPWVGQFIIIITIIIKLSQKIYLTCHLS